MRLWSVRNSKLLVVFALICAMASSGFAHRFVSQSLDPALAAYVAAGGSLEDICGPTKGSSHQIAQSCEACRLVNAAVLPVHDPAGTALFGKLAVVRVPVQETELRSAELDLSSAARGPPAA
jgi:hypothetical protein